MSYPERNITNNSDSAPNWFVVQGIYTPNESTTLEAVKKDLEISQCANTSLRKTNETIIEINRVLVKQCHEMMTQSTQLTQESQNTQEQLMTLQSLVVMLTKRTQDVKRKVDELEQENKKLKTKNSETAENIQSTFSQLQGYEEENKTLKTMCDIQAKTLEEQLKMWEKQTDELTKENKILKEKNNQTEDLKQKTIQIWLEKKISEENMKRLDSIDRSLRKKNAVLTLENKTVRNSRSEIIATTKRDFEKIRISNEKMNGYIQIVDENTKQQIEDIKVLRKENEILKNKQSNCKSKEALTLEMLEKQGKEFSEHFQALQNKVDDYLAQNATSLLFYNELKQLFLQNLNPPLTKEILINKLKDLNFSPEELKKAVKQYEDLEKKEKCLRQSKRSAARWKALTGISAIINIVFLIKFIR